MGIDGQFMNSVVKAPGTDARTPAAPRIAIRARLTHSRQLRCAMAQLNLVVGDVDGNTSRIVAAAVAARNQHRADVVLVPELAVSGYPPEDLLFHSGMRLQVGRSLERLKQEVRGITLIAGYPEYVGTKIFNSAIVIRDGAVLANHRKACLPNYRVFDEKRYFTPGTEPTLVELNGVKAGVLVCEDVWDAEPARQARAQAHRCSWSSTLRLTKSVNRRSVSRKSRTRG